MANNRGSAWDRLVNFFRSRTHRKLDELETVEDIAHQQMSKLNKMAEDQTRATEQAITNRSIMQNQYQRDVGAYKKLEIQVEAATKEAKKLVTADNDPEKLEQYQEYLESMITEMDDLRETIEASAVDLQQQNAVVEDLKKAHRHTKREIGRIEREKNTLVAKGARAEAAHKAIESAKAVSTVGDVSTILDPLRKKVEMKEGRAIASMEMHSSDPTVQRKKLEREISTATASTRVTDLLEGKKLKSPGLSEEALQLTQKK